MDKKLVEGILKNNDLIFGFVGFDDWTDFDKIIAIIKNRINPDNLDYQGMTDMNGYFVKDGLHVEIRYNSMMGNDLVFKEERTEENLNKLRKWSKVIFDNLMIGNREENA